MVHFHAANPERERGKRHDTSGDWEGEWEIWMAFEGLARTIMQGRSEVAENCCRNAAEQGSNGWK